MAGRIRILIAQNYSLADIERAVLAGTSARHHLWGADLLRAAGFEVAVLGPPELRRLGWITRLTSGRLGDVRRQLTLVRYARRMKADLIVCGETTCFRGLAILRRWRVFRLPMIGVVHAHESGGWPRLYSDDGFDAQLHISRSTSTLGRLAGTEASRVVHWGPDLDFPGYTSRDTGVVVSVGRTHRDLTLLTEAARMASVPLIVHARVATPPSDRVERIGAGPEAALADLAASAVVAIPLLRTNGAFGTTELNDALALGKPIVMTRSPHIDLDLEEVGCGILVDKGDAPGWAAALSRLMSDQSLRATMGQRGREFARSHWNYEQFGDALVEMVNDTLVRCKNGRRRSVAGLGS